jgi:hypothetical protein
MRFCWTVIAVAALALIVTDPAAARKRHHVKLRCDDYPVHFSWYGVWSNPAPRPNGCAPPVYAYGEYIGQDPDPFIRSQLLRDPTTGYTSKFSR